MRGRRPSKTSDLPVPNQYVQMLTGEYSHWAFDEERAPQFHGNWRSEIFKVDADYPLDLEIGTGNGFYFAHHAQKNSERALIGIEIKYKPLIQSIRRAHRIGANNARIVRYNASLLSELFKMGELNNVIIHFPDPWPRKKQWKHRLIQDQFLSTLFSLQRPGSSVEFKTDSRDYFEWTMERVKRSPYRVQFESWDLYKDYPEENWFNTHFEKIFRQQGLPIHRTVFVRE